MPQLSVNVDHVATVRQARYRSGGSGSGGIGGAHLQIAAEPDPARAAHEAELGGADGITFHLREDRRHMQDRDVTLLKQLVRVRLNFEMAATDEMVAICSRVGPHTSMLVPEGRDEVTTEGGLDAARSVARLKDVVARLKGDGMQVSAFIDADPEQIDAAARIGFDVCEVHTGPYAAAFACAGGDTRRAELIRELDRVADAGRRIRAAGMRFNAGHALNYANVSLIAAMPGVAELHIGHAIVSRAIYTGIRQAVVDMKRAMVGDGMV
ncbi:MAG: pyridoxine 5'-phosphate synthase [Pyrinomonadaceae bacterium]|nr:pyridoxine 5'-phosphate synthase [Phycisphaerales bacterium]